MDERISSTSVELREGTPLDRIVVPLALDGESERGLKAASILAGRWNLPVYLVSASTGSGRSLDDLEDMFDRSRSTLTASGQVAEVTSAILKETVDPVAAIVSVLTSFDLVVMTTQGARDVGGSFAQSLTHLWGGPVLMLGPNAELVDLTGDIVIGLDGSALAEKALAPATAIAAALGVRMKIIEAVPAALTNQVERLKARGERVSESAYVRDVAERLGTAGVTWAISHSDVPAQALANEAEKGASLLVLATHGQSGLARATFGSVCMETVSIAPRPVLVVRPTSLRD